MTISTGEATLRLLGRYGVDTVFGIPGVHTLELYRGLGEGSGIRHVQARNEMGAGFMADGYARATGRPGVVLTISGPGVTNATTALGQAYADSMPLLLISADATSRSLGKGWGLLHEVTDLNAVTRPLTALSALAREPEDVPDLLAQAFTIFASERPRPVHIAIPEDILARHVEEVSWHPVTVPDRPCADPEAIGRAASLLRDAVNPVVMVGGGAIGADVATIAERLGSIVVSSSAGKGVVPDTHPFSVSCAIGKPDVHRVIADADAILAIGTELSETDSFIPELPIDAPIVRIDIDGRKMNDQYPAAIPIIADAAPACAALIDALGPETRHTDAEARVAVIRDKIEKGLNPSEVQHARLLETLREKLPAETLVVGDTCQIVYTACFALPFDEPRLWHYATGYCALGFAFPNAIGAKLGKPDAPVIALVGDGGLMFAVQEMVTAAELKLPIPMIVWENGGYKQIRDDMRSNNVPRVGVDGMNPDFPALAAALHCKSAEPESMEAFVEAVEAAFKADRPTLILVHEGAGWLQPT
ncbi:MAG: 5-guanidino-2-oxopentanoate decarboxylase [Pseudomonadota bacterium]